MTPNPGPPLPIGRVTMLFTDIEGSTRLLEALGSGYADLLQSHRRVLRRVWADHRGVEVSVDGDAFFVAFADAQDAVDAAVAAQRTLKAREWPGRVGLRVRMGVHTGSPELLEDERDYWGPDVHLAARVAGAAHGGQVLVTARTAELVRADFDDLGEWRLKDFDAPIRLLQPVIEGEGADAFPVPRAVDVRASNLPRPSTALVGRDADVAELSQLLSGRERLVTIVGMGGVGKTRLALAVGHALLEHFRDGVFFVDLSGVGDPAAVPELTAETIGVGADGSLIDTAGHRLRDRRMLVILDNCEHVLEGVALLSGWLEAAPELRFLATSQAPLGLRRERCVFLESLPVPRASLTNLAELGEVPSVQLFLARARAVDPGIELSDRTAGAIGEICVRLEGMPMAIEIAAAQCRILTPAQLARRLERDLFSLGAGHRDAPARQRSLDAAMEWAVGLLDESSRIVFARWGVLAGRPTLERAEAIVGADVDVIAAAEALVNHSLLRRDPDGRLRMPQSVHAYARRLLDDSGETELLRRCHARVMADVAEAQHRGVMLDTTATLEDAVAERDDLYAALRWSDATDPALHARLAACMALPLLLSGTLASLEPHLEKALAFEAGPSLTRVRLLAADGLVGYARGERARERVGFERGIEMAEEIGDDRERALTLAAYAKAVASGEQPDVDALMLLEQARPLAPSAGGRVFEDLIGGLAAEVHLNEGRLDEATRLFSLAVGDPTARHFAAAQVPSYLPDLAFERDDYREALEASVRLLRRALHGGPQNLVWGVEYIGVCLLALGESRRALMLIGAAEANGDRIGMSGRPSRQTAYLREQLSIARDRIGTDAVETALAEGRRTEWDVAVGLALRAPTIVSHAVMPDR